MFSLLIVLYLSLSCWESNEAEFAMTLSPCFGFRGVTIYSNADTYDLNQYDQNSADQATFSHVNLCMSFF
jgi:hypothetical protein